MLQAAWPGKQLPHSSSPLGVGALVSVAFLSCALVLNPPPHPTPIHLLPRWPYPLFIPCPLPRNRPAEIGQLAWGRGRQGAFGRNQSFDRN